MDTLSQETPFAMNAVPPTALTQPAPPLRYFDDYLNAPDFPRNFMPLTEPLGTRLGLPEHPDELGLVCANVEKSVEELQNRYPGMGPFFIGQGAPERFIELGESKHFETRVAFGYYRGTLIEIAEVGHGSDFFAPALDPGGRVTVHHLGFYARGNNLRRRLNGETHYFADRLYGGGHRVLARALVSALGFLGRITVFDTTADTEGNIPIEFLDFRLLWETGIPVPLPNWALSAVARYQMKHGPRIYTLG